MKQSHCFFSEAIVCSHPPQDVVNNKESARNDIKDKEQFIVFPEHERNDANNYSNQHHPVIYTRPFIIVAIILWLNYFINQFSYFHGKSSDMLV